MHVNFHFSIAFWAAGQMEREREKLKKWEGSKEQLKKKSEREKETDLVHKTYRS